MIIWKRNKRAHGMVDEVIKWIMYIGLAAAAGAAIFFIVRRFA